MTRQTLVVARRPVTVKENGYDLRVANLCARTEGDLRLFVIPIEAGPVREPTIDPARIFRTVEVLRPPPERKSLGRHLRVSNDRYYAHTYPSWAGAVRQRLEEFAQVEGIGRVVVFGSELAEFVLHLPGVLVLDVCDSRSLTIQRELESEDRRDVRRWVEARRWIRTERHLSTRFAAVTTASDADRQAVVRASRGRAQSVHTVPNGLDPAYLEPIRAAGDVEGVAFWGNLAFAPNEQALRWFVEHVHRPYLRGRGVGLLVIGADAPTWLEDLAADDPLVSLPGFVPDLAAAVTRYPVMVNPMRSGSGIKNKVLEAFGLGLAVVSTRRGMEGIPLAEDGVHHLTADDAAAFACCVVELLEDRALRAALTSSANRLVHDQYTWDAVAGRWRTALERADLR